MKDLEAKVIEILKEYPQARDSDKILYILLIDELNPNVLKRTFEDVFLNGSKLGLPNYESVTRARRKVQSNCPELGPSENADGKRYKYWKVMMEYAAE